MFFTTSSFTSQSDTFTTAGHNVFVFSHCGSLLTVPGVDCVGEIYGNPRPGWVALRRVLAGRVVVTWSAVRLYSIKVWQTQRLDKVPVVSGRILVIQQLDRRVWCTGVWVSVAANNNLVWIWTGGHRSVYACQYLPVQRYNILAL